MTATAPPPATTARFRAALDEAVAISDTVAAVADLIDRTPPRFHPRIAVITLDEVRAALGARAAAPVADLLTAGAVPARPERLVTVADGPFGPMAPGQPPLHFAPEVLAAYRDLAVAARDEIGGELRVAAAYRSPVFQILLLLWRIARAGGDIDATLRLVATPATSEHCRPHHHALDFVTPESNGADDPWAAFPRTPEYAWLRERAGDFGFVESIPEGNASGMAAEPWHWRFDG